MVNSDHIRAAQDSPRKGRSWAGDEPRGVQESSSARFQRATQDWFSVEIRSSHASTSAAPSSRPALWAIEALCGREVLDEEGVVSSRRGIPAGTRRGSRRSPPRPSPTAPDPPVAPPAPDASPLPQHRRVLHPCWHELTLSGDQTLHETRGGPLVSVDYSGVGEKASVGRNWGCCEMSDADDLVDSPLDDLLTELQSRVRGGGGPPDSEDRRLPSARLAAVDTKSIVEAARAGQRVINGVDDRPDLSEVDLDLVLRDADSVVSAWNAHGIEDNGNGTSSLQTIDLGVAKNLCEGEAFRGQPTGPFCSEFSGRSEPDRNRRRRDEGLSDHARVRLEQRQEQRHHTGYRSLPTHDGPTNGVMAPLHRLS